MGLRGPPPKPNVVRLLTGNAARRPINLSDGINPDVAVPDAPSWLCRDGLKEWKRITVELEAIGLISRLDRAALTLYCQTWGQLCLLERAFLAQQKGMVEKGREAGMDLDVAAMRAFFAATPSGFVRQAPLYRQISELREECNRYLAAFGLSPTARMRVKASAGQGELFEKPDKLGELMNRARGAA